MLAVGRSVGIIANDCNEMDSAGANLQLQKSASEEELLATLQRITDQRLKFLCNESGVKSSGIKTEREGGRGGEGEEEGQKGLALELYIVTQVQLSL